MIYKIAKPKKEIKGTIAVPASKSESNRLLIIKSLCKEPFEIKNLSDSEDTKALQKILISENKKSETVHDVGNAGTTMRFLTAYFATQPGVRTLTGSDRMKQRPIKILVDALRQFGAKITYTEKEGFAPLKIEGTKLKGGEITMDGNVSSQYISALLLIAPQLGNGLTVKFSGTITSRPYIRMTLKIMETFGVISSFDLDTITIASQQYQVKDKNFYYEIEADRTAASYWYSMAAMAKETDLKLIGLKKNGLQGDAIVSDLFTLFGVKTEFTDNGVRLTKLQKKIYDFVFNFSDCPDLAQTMAVVVAALKIPAILTGLQTLRIKETDRIKAIQNELKKIAVIANEKETGSLEILLSYIFHPQTSPFSTYNDHRMAMAFAPLALMFNEIKIENPDVVKKSYPGFWKDMRSVGFEITEE